MQNNKLAFALTELGSGQIPYICISESNQFLNKKTDLDIVIFYEESAVPCVALDFARFHVRDSCYFKGNLICTSLSTIKSTEKAFCAKRFFYINDIIEQIKNKEEFDLVMKNKDIVKFTRCGDYYDYLTKLRYELSDIIVKDFDINTILQLMKES